ncbi:MAG: Fic family protein [Acholeplasmatales bacterium]|nr:Fic family protein [Acholeplasmatales bacterium]
MNSDPYKEYIISKEPSKEEKQYAWYTAIGLQKVDGLETSSYLNDLAKKNINGEITLPEAKILIDSYYEELNDTKETTLEADKVSTRIAEILSSNSFSYSLDEYFNIHEYLFKGIIKNAGEVRKFDITKKEWVLDGDTVTYGSCQSLYKTLEYDFNMERNFDYSKLSIDETIKHLARFVSNLWQIHVFPEGNTRTTAVFLIKYLRKLGFNVNNDLFANNSWYFRNALVRANYNNYEKNIKEDTSYLELFLRNLLLKENNDLKNRYMHISHKKEDFKYKKPDIETKKPDIDVNSIINDLAKYNFISKTKDNIIILIKTINNNVFSRKEVSQTLNLSPSRSSDLIKQMLDNNIIVSVKGFGKGKYKFRKIIG